MRRISKEQLLLCLRLSFAPQSMTRVLVVDDHLDTANSLAVLLRDMGHETQFAINGYAALAIGAKFRPQIVIVDLRLPDCDGCALAQRMKRDLKLEMTRFIAITGHAALQDRQKALDAGCEELLPKPIDLGQLEKLVAK
jgi:CheY-like chemotaxis protein